MTGLLVSPQAAAVGTAFHGLVPLCLIEASGVSRTACCWRPCAVRSAGRSFLPIGVLVSVFFALAELRSERLLPRRVSSRLMPHTWKVLDLTPIPWPTTCLIRR